ncbi:metal ABC transporter substrate-binding protein [Paenibacillus mendelii]|uniref:Metal ABC transporter substrate-binding protein n=1 Tax=Paenibacillus mendelii TaxID=206163 RepID=A0ABV6JHB0_9BACL|nr:metal ABC transporter substrate-binding protein [Paenibacillus mendelii]MCQ6558181.1 metal ABC transporter substrate-binding protein [Paenibacillus mendelii]
MRFQRYGTMAAVMLMIMTTVLAGCGSGQESKLAEGKTNVVTSFYPLYFLAQQIGGEQANVINLIPAGVEPHDWSPKSQDLDTTSNAQLFLYNGAGFEGWTDDFLQGLRKDSKLVTREASDGIKLIEGDSEDGHDHGHEEEANHEEEESGHHDPHTWVSPKSMKIMAANVLDSLSFVDPDHKADYEANYKQLETKLNALDDEYTAKLGAAPKKDIVVSHHAFSYLARDYGLNQVSIMGLSPDAEPKAQDLLNISKFVKENGVKYIFFEELVSDELARTLAREADAETLVLNPLEGLTPDQEKNGDDYFSLMTANLQNLLQALQ